VGPRLLILAALRYEAVALARSLGLTFTGPSVATGVFPDGRPVELRVAGMKCGALPRDLGTGTYGGIVMTGLAGALDPSLRIGDVVLDDRSDFNVPEDARGWRRGGIHTAPALVSTPAEKASLFGQTGALVVDMENEVARGLAADQGVPFLGLRAVSDCAGEALNPAVTRLIDRAGRLRMTGLARELCRRPALLADLWRMRAGSRHAMGNLSRVLREILTTGTTPV
jgi:hypothetical protein